MNHPKSELYFLAIFFSIISVLVFFIFKPFILAIILAIVFAVIFHPLHEKILFITKGRKGLSAFLAMLAVLITIIVPLTFLGIQIFQEATRLYSSLASGESTISLSRNVDGYLENLAAISPIPINIPVDFSQYLKQGLSWLLQHIGPIFANVLQIILGIFISLIALYYLFKDGHRLKSVITKLSPLQDVYNKLIFNKLFLSINSVVKGSLVVALVQGILTAVGLTIFGVPNAVLWGSAAAITALIPGLGTMLVLLPAILYLYFNGMTTSAIGLSVWGIVAVGLVDNFLGPELVGKGVQLHPFLILLSILGGISFFGPFGFLLGPIVLSLFFTLLEIHFSIKKEYKS